VSTMSDKSWWIMRGKKAAKNDASAKINPSHKTDKGETSQAFNQSHFQDQMFYVTYVIFPLAPFQTCLVPSKKLYVLKIKNPHFFNGLHFTETSELLLHPT